MLVRGFSEDEARARDNRHRLRPLRELFESTCTRANSCSAGPLHCHLRERTIVSVVLAATRAGLRHGAVHMVVIVIGLMLWQLTIVAFVTGRRG